MATRPLPLAAFEEYMLLDDFPEHPMCFFARLRFDRRLPLDSVAAGVRDALARHPLLAARVVGTPGRWAWAFDASSPVVVEHHSPDDSHFPPAAPIDLFASSGVRVWLQHVGDHSRLVVQFHHACTDGLGALMFLDDLLVGIADFVARRDSDGASSSVASHESLALASLAASAAANESGAALLARPRAKRASRSLDPALLPRRGRFGLTAWSLLKLLPRLTRGLVGARNFFGRKASPLAPPRSDAPRDPTAVAFPAARTVEFTADETERHRAAADAAGATVNDALLRDLMLACAAWRTKRKLGAADDWIRVCVPINLRTHADARTPAANIVTMVFLDSPQGETNADRVLADVAARMETVKTNRLGLILPLLLATLRRLPGGMKRMIQSDDCRATAVLTNVGVPLARSPLPRSNGKIVVGDATLDGFDLLAPVRRGTAAAFAVWKYAGRLSITCHFDSRVLSADDADALLAEFASRVRAAGSPLAT